MEVISIERLREMFTYNPDTGEIRHLTHKRGTSAGTVAGCLDGQGYRVMGIERRQYQAHRVAWALHFGVWPEGQIDHKNLIKSDNRIDNLRIATPSQNLCNIAKTRANTSGKKGVTWNKRASRWQASIRVNGKPTYLGLYDNLDDAHAAYCAAANDNHGQFARTQ